MNTVGTRLTRRVWAYLTAHPSASIPEIARAVACGAGTVQGALLHLAALGYIEYTPKVARGRRVIVPFAEVRKSARIVI